MRDSVKSGAFGLATRDPTNTEWEVDVAVSCAMLGNHVGMSTDERRGYLRRGLDVEQGLKDLGRLLPNQDWSAWSNVKLAYWTQMNNYKGPATA